MKAVCTCIKVSSAVVFLLFVVGCGRSSDSPPPPDPSESPVQPDQDDSVLVPNTDDGSSMARPGGSDSPESSASSSPPEPIPRLSSAVNPQELRDEALTALESGDSGEALRLIRRSVAGDPEDPEALFVMARVLAERNRFAEAIRMLDGLAERMPGLEIPVLGQTAEWSVFQGQWEEAERRYRALREEVDDAGRQMVDRRLAQLLLRQGRRLDANVHLQRLCRGGNIGVSELRSLLCGLHPLEGDFSDDDESQPIGPLGRARYAIGEGNWEQALRELDPSKAKSPESMALRGRVLAQLELWDELDKWAEELPQSTRESADAWVATGVLAARNEDHAAAVRALEEAVLQDPTDWRSYRAMEQSLRELGRISEADAVAQRAEKIERTQRLGDQLMADDAATVAISGELRELLQQLQRPWESLAWGAMQVVYQKANGAMSDAEVKQALEQINRQRLALPKDAETTPP